MCTCVGNGVKAGICFLFGLFFVIGSVGDFLVRVSIACLGLWLIQCGLEMTGRRPIYSYLMRIVQYFKKE